MEDIHPIFELKDKIETLMKWGKAYGGPDLRSERTIQDKTGIPRNTIRSAATSGRMSVAVQKSLAELFGFETEWPEWRDIRAFAIKSADRRRDTAAAFENRFTATKFGLIPLTIEDSSTKNHIDPRFANFSFSIMGSFEPRIDAPGIPLTLSLSFDRRGWQLPVEGGTQVVKIGLRQVEVQLKPKNTDHGRIRILPIYCNSLEEGNFHGSVQGLSAWWIIDVCSEDQWLMGVRRRNDSEDCVLSGFRYGDVICATMTARISDCFVELPTESLGPVSNAKLRILEHLSKLQIIEDVEVRLAEQVLKVVQSR
jgi:hypothetical protein